MDTKIAKTFNEQVCSMIEDEQGRDKVYEALKIYHNNHDIVQFVSDLKNVLNDPTRLPLFDDIRFLVPPHHQIAYDKLMPMFDLDSMKIVRLTRHSNDSLGFSVRGGFEHDVGVYVSDVDPDSQAYEQGLRVGDEIVRLNGFTINQAIHQEVLNLIKANRELVLKVRHVGMIPVKDEPGDKVRWKYVDVGGSTNNLMSTDSAQPTLKPGEEAHLYINIPVTGTLGCSICSGPSHQPGIFIQSVKQGSLAEEAGLEVGDQILQVNDVILKNITHSEAIVAFKSTKHLDLVIRKAVGIGLFKPDNEPATSFMDRKGKHGMAEDKEFKDHSNHLKSTEDKQEVNWKQEDLLQQVIQVIDSNEPHSETSSAKLKAAIGVIGHSSDDQRKDQQVKVEIHAWSASTDNRLKELGHNTQGQDKKQTNLYHKNNEPVYSEIEEVTSLKNQPIRTGFDKPLTSQPPFPEATTDFRTSPSYQTTIVNTGGTQADASVPKPFTPKSSTVWSSGTVQHGTAQTSTVNRNVTTVTISANQSAQIKTQPKQLNPKIYRPIEIQSFQNQIPVRSSKSPTSYLTEERKPNFRIQKPVLLHQTYKKEDDNRKDEDRQTSGELGKPFFNAATFNPNRLFTNEQIAGRQVKLVTINKTGCNDLGIVIETSQDRVIVGEVYEDGAVQKQGGVHVGDQIMMVNRHSLIGVPVERAYKLLRDEFRSSTPVMQLVVAKAPPSAFGSEVLPRPDYLDIPISNLDDYTDDDVEICMYNNGIPVTII